MVRWKVTGEISMSLITLLNSKQVRSSLSYYFFVVFVTYSSCPRIIISYSFPYEWETNNCTTIDVGFHIWGECHRGKEGQ